jgi:para-aminobenzoate synthetase component 2
MIVMIDNYDSFTYNLVQYFGEQGAEIQVYRNDAIDPEGIRALHPSQIVISPGPCTPNEAGISVDVIREVGPEIPLLGVCLGHQSIGAAFGGNVVRADRIMHGKTSEIRHFGDSLFKGIESPFTATRYHSLIIERASCPDCLEITAETDEGEIMAVRHKEHPIVGVQFHPESILTGAGKQIIRNFLAS